MSWGHQLEARDAIHVNLFAQVRESGEVSCIGHQKGDEQPPLLFGEEEIHDRGQRISGLARVQQALHFL